MTTYWIMHPVRSVKERLEFVEDRRGIPLAIRIFMGCARSSALAITAIAASTIALISRSIVAEIGVLVLLTFGTLSSDIPAADPFTRLGFWMFKYIIVQRGNDDRPARPSLVRSSSPPRRAMTPEKRGGGLKRPWVHGIRARVQGGRTRVDGQHEPRDRRLARRTTLLGGRGRRQRGSLRSSRRDEGGRV